MQHGFLITRGLGCKGLLVTRGLGSCVHVIITPPEAIGPLRQVRQGGSGRREGRYPGECIFINARLVEINGQVLEFPIEGVQQVDCRKDDTLRVTARLVSARRKIKSFSIRARLVRSDDS